MPRGQTHAQPRSKAGLALALFVGALLFCIGGVRSWGELQLSLHGVRARGHVVAWLISRREGNSADVEIAQGPGAPVRVHLVGVPSNYPWADGLGVDLVCPEIRAGATGCEIDDWRYRFVAPAGFLGVGLAFLAWGLFSARRPS